MIKLFTLLASMLVSNFAFSNTDYLEINRFSFQHIRGQQYKTNVFPIGRGHENFKYLNIYSPTEGCSLFIDRVWIKASFDSEYRILARSRTGGGYEVKGGIDVLYFEFKASAFDRQICEVVTIASFESRHSELGPAIRSSKEKAAELSLSFLTMEGYRELKPIVEDYYIQLNEMERMIEEGSNSEVYALIANLEKDFEGFEGDFFRVHADNRNESALEKFLSFKESLEALFEQASN